MAIQIAYTSRAVAKRLPLALRVTFRSAHFHSVCQEAHDHSQNISISPVAPLASEISSQWPYEAMMEMHKWISYENPQATIPPHHVESIVNHLQSHQIQDQPNDAALLHIYRGWVLTVTH
ncbi:uncharacterized protein LOC123504570 [Portunus trituberculatus]|uniref:uncharacterized protein LOC123504570 n=1 Tax=Portunus trituberculatus TaxID=210409 RepID=UPI001E1D0213|nr:uncharacterized protein LOC123504570 [Portunus trituberculatus]